MTYDELYVLYQRAVADVVRLSRQNGEQAVEIERLTEAWVDGKMREDRDALLADNKRLRHDLARAVENHTRDLGEVERLRGLLREVQERAGFSDNLGARISAALYTQPDQPDGAA